MPGDFRNVEAIRCQVSGDVADVKRFKMSLMINSSDDE